MAPAFVWCIPSWRKKKKKKKRNN